MTSFDVESISTDDLLKIVKTWKEARPEDRAVTGCVFRSDVNPLVSEELPEFHHVYVSDIILDVQRELLTREQLERDLALAESLLELLNRGSSCALIVGDILTKARMGINRRKEKGGMQ